MAEYDDDILRPLSDPEVDELLDLYEQKYGKRNFHYLLMYQQHKWHQKLSKVVEDANSPEWLSFRKQFYTYRKGDFRETGTYVSLHYDKLQSLAFNTWQPDRVDLYEALEQTKRIDWRNGPLLTNVELEDCERVKEIALNKGVQVQRARLCVGKILEHDKALQLEFPSPPAGYMVRKLVPEDIPFIHGMWTNKGEGSLQFVKGLTEMNKTLGICRLADQKLVAWIFQNDYAGLGILQVLPEEQRRGFGSLLVRQLSKLIADTESCHVSVWAVAENERSLTLLKKCGFEREVLNEWIQLAAAKE